MKKIEIIWREMLFRAIEKQTRRFTQKELAAKFGFSTSTVFQALKPARRSGAVRVGGRFFTLEDPEKLLYHWASARNFAREIIFSGRVAAPVFEIEGNLPPEAVFAGYSAARFILGEPPADYDKVYCYLSPEEGNLAKLKERFSFAKGPANLFVLTADPFLQSYGQPRLNRGQKTSLAQTFVDLWNLTDWYGRDFSRAIKEKIDGLLS